MSRFWYLLFITQELRCSVPTNNKSPNSNNLPITTKGSEANASFHVSKTPLNKRTFQIKTAFEILSVFWMVVIGRECCTSNLIRISFNAFLLRCVLLLVLRAFENNLWRYQIHTFWPIWFFFLYSTCITFIVLFEIDLGKYEFYGRLDQVVYWY